MFNSVFFLFDFLLHWKLLVNYTLNSIEEVNFIILRPLVYALLPNLHRGYFSGGVDTEEMLDIERQQLKECIPGVYSRQYLPLSRQVSSG